MPTPYQLRPAIQELRSARSAILVRHNEAMSWGEYQVAADLERALEHLDYAIASYEAKMPQPKPS